MRTRLFASTLIVAAVLIAPAKGAAAQTLAVCVGGEQGCYSTIQAAVDAAHDGDVIHVGEGTFAGGVKIDKDVELIGAGASHTTIRGGGPVVTIGLLEAEREPTVTIRGVTITGGATHDSGSVGGTFIALGGGIWVPPARHGTTGATVRISQSVISANRVSPTSAVPSGLPCPNGSCPFALAGGGGIDNWGTTTLTDTTVSNNEVAGPLTSDADGAGIDSHEGTLTLDNDIISGNRAIASGPSSRFAEGGGLMVDRFLAPRQASGALRISHSVVTDNVVRLTSSLPSFAGGGLIGMGANSGGIHVGDGIPTTVENTLIADNSVTATDLNGEPVGFDSGMLVGVSQLMMRNSTITGNSVTSISATSADVGAGGSALEMDGAGTVINTRITRNTSVAISPNGIAGVDGALAVFDSGPPRVTVQDSVISGNVAIASSETGSATVFGAGVFNNGPLLLRDVTVSDNVGRSTAPTGVAQGGGIWNGAGPSGPPPQLVLEKTIVTRNRLEGSDGITLGGGGIFTTVPITLVLTLIKFNRPDQCIGC